MRRLTQIAFVLLAVQAHATTHNVPGTYATVTLGIAAASAGDTVLIAAGAYNEDLSLQNKDGAAGSPIYIIGVDSVAIYSSDTTLAMYYSSYIEFQNIEFFGGTRTLYGYDIDHITWRDCEFRASNGAGGKYIDNLITGPDINNDTPDATNTFIRIIGGEVTEHNGDVTDREGASDLLVMYDADSVLIQNVTFSNAEHYAINGLRECSYVIIEHCTFTNCHGGIGSQFEGGSKIFVQNNLFYNVHVNEDEDDAAGWPFQGAIDTGAIRYNRFAGDTLTGGWNSGAAYLSITQYDSNTYTNMDIQNLAIVHNTVNLDQAGDTTAMAPFGIYPQSNSNIANKFDTVFIANNIFQLKNSIQGSGLAQAVVYTRDMRPVGAYAAGALPLIFKGNYLWNSGDQDSVVRPGSTTYLSVSGAISAYPAIWLSTNQQYPSGISNDTSLSLPDSSQCRGAAVALTQTKFAGTSVDTVTVGIAAFFTDGFGLITGDSILIAGASDSICVVTGVNYATRKLTLDAATTYDAGAGIFYVKNGVRADDVGAVQYGSAEAPSTPSTTKYLRGYR